ncbi:MAG: hypothetical protein ABFR89_11435 [Actinomycetota bacterium]
MMKPTTAFAVLMVVLAMLAAACGGGSSDEVAEQLTEKLLESSGDGSVDVDISEDGDDVTVNIETEDGESISLGTGADLPEGLEIPVPDGGDVMASGSQAGAVFVSITYERDRYDELVEFYESWTGGSGGEWDLQSTTMDVGEDTQRSSSWYGPEYTSAIIVSDCFSREASEGKFNAACVTITQGE